MFYTNLNEYNNTVLCNEAEIEESIYTDFEEGALNAIAENESNYNKLIEAIGLMESAVFEENGEVVYTEAMLGSIWESLKSFLMKVWQKIVALFKRFVAMFDQYFKGDKEFVKKYRAKVMQSDAKDLDYNGYTFKDLDTKIKALDVDDYKLNTSIQSGTNQTYNADTEDKQDKIDEVMDSFRAKMCGKSGGKVDSSDFSDELKEAYYGSDSPESLDDPDLGAQLRFIDNSRDNIKDAIDLKNKIEKAFKRVIKDIDDVKGTKMKEKGQEAYNNAAKNATEDEKKAASDKANSEFAKNNNLQVTILHQKSSALTQTLGVALNALKDRNRQARSICVKAMTKSGKFKNESASVEGFQYPAYGDSFLTGIQFK